MTDLALSPEVLARRVYRDDVNRHLRETTILKVLASYVDPAKAAIDVGAATGHITCWLSEHCAHVYAFEAVHAVYNQLIRWEAKRKNVQAFCAAIGQENGPVKIFVDHKRLSNSGFQDLVGGPSVEVAGASLDALFVTQQPPLPIGFIKIDVEGTELDVLKGAEKLIDRDRPNLMVEIYKPYAADPLDAIFKWLMEERGYRCAYYINGSNGKLIDVPDVSAGVNAVEELHSVHDGDFLFYQERG